MKDILVVLDFDGFLIDSYALMKKSFACFGLDIGDKDRFKNRRKFLKYLGGGKEFLHNFVFYSLPKKKRLREVLTECYMEEGEVFTEFAPLINYMIEKPGIHVGIISRNFTYSPGLTIRKVLANSGIDEANIDFIIPVATGSKKHHALTAMKSSRYRINMLGGDEIGDYTAAILAGYETIFMASYGFDNKERLIDKGNISPELVYDTPQEAVNHMAYSLNIELISPELLSIPA